MIGEKYGLGGKRQEGFNLTRFLRTHLSQASDGLQTECLYRFRNPVSPHLAARESKVRSVTLLMRIAKVELESTSSYGQGICLISCRDYLSV